MVTLFVASALANMIPVEMAPCANTHYWCPIDTDCLQIPFAEGQLPATRDRAVAEGFTIQCESDQGFFVASRPKGSAPVESKRCGTIDESAAGALLLAFAAVWGRRR